MKIKVKKKHIAEADRYRQKLEKRELTCPIALAVQEKFDERISVSRYEIRFNEGKDGMIYLALPQNAREFIYAYDFTEVASPFEFELV
jgi:hypothetical protein